MTDEERREMLAELAAGTAVLLGEPGAEKAGRAGLAPRLAIHHPRLGPLLLVGRDLLGDELPELGAELIVVLGKKRAVHADGVTRTRRHGPRAALHGLSALGVAWLRPPSSGRA